MFDILNPSQNLFVWLMSMTGLDGETLLNRFAADATSHLGRSVSSYFPFQSADTSHPDDPLVLILDGPSPSVDLIEAPCETNPMDMTGETYHPDSSASQMARPSFVRSGQTHPTPDGGLSPDEGAAIYPRLASFTTPWV